MSDVLLIMLASESIDLETALRRMNVFSRVQKRQVEQFFGSSKPSVNKHRVNENPEKVCSTR
jgi:hypothetical protein